MVDIFKKIDYDYYTGKKNSEQEDMMKEEK
jgi:hypothetical protein